MCKIEKVLYTSNFFLILIFLQVIVPKRAALLFDQLMVALQKVVDNQGKGAIGSRGISKSSAPRFIANPEIPGTDDQTVANSVLIFK